MPRFAPVWLTVFLLASDLRADEPAPAATTRGTVKFRPLEDQGRLPEIYRLEEHEFPFEMVRVREIGEAEVHEVRFPSPLTTPHAENNTVHAEYYRPKGPGPFPGVICLDILGGNNVARLQATLLAQNGVAGLFVQMPYYGPRRPPGSKVRMILPNLDHSLKSVRQAVLDIRRAAAWLEARPEIDRERLGLMGTSLGSFIGAVAAEMEPRLKRVALLLGGGGLVDAFYDDPRAKVYRQFWEAIGGSKQRLQELLANVDPITHAANLRGRKLLIIAARRDEIVPPKATEALWLATGKPKIVWYDATHVGAAAYFLPALVELLDLFLPVESGKE